MKLHYYIYFVGLFFLPISLNGQDLKEVTKDDLLQTYHPLDSTASAAYLYSSVSINYIFNTGRYIMQRLKYQYRIKVYDEAGESYGSFSIPLYRKNLAIEEISRIKAKSYNLINGEVIQQKLKKKDIFRDEYRKDVTVRTFAIPNVKKGSIIDVEYEIQSPFTYRIPRWFFQQYIPVDQSVYTLLVPKYLELTPIAKGLHPVVVDKKKSHASNHGEIRYRISATNIPPIKKDKFVLNEDDYRLSIKYEISESRFPGNLYQKYSDDWNSIGKGMMKDGDFGKQISKKIKVLEPFVKQIEGWSEKERMDTIYHYVRDHFAWNGYCNKYADLGIKKLLKTGKGNSADINLLLINLLLKSGLKASPIVTLKRDSGLFNPIFPNHTDLNYVFAKVDIEGKIYYLDASSKFAAAGVLPERAVNLAGLRPFKNNGEIVDIVNPNISKTQTLVTYEIDLEDGVLRGEGSSKKSYFAALKYRRKHMNTETKISLKELFSSEELEREEDDKETDNTATEDNELPSDDDTLYEEEYDYEDEFISEDFYEVKHTKNLNQVDKPVVVEFEEVKRSSIKVIGSQIFIDATLGEGISENPFVAESRAYPIFFPSKVDELNVWNIKIPEGYKVEFIPEPVVLVLPAKKGRFSLKIAQRGDTLSIQLILKINSDVFLQEEYQSLKEFYRMAIEKQDQKIILTKA